MVWLESPSNIFTAHASDNFLLLVVTTYPRSKEPGYERTMDTFTSTHIFVSFNSYALDSLAPASMWGYDATLFVLYIHGRKPGQTGGSFLLFETYNIAWRLLLAAFTFSYIRRSAAFCSVWFLEDLLRTQEIDQTCQRLT